MDRRITTKAQRVGESAEFRLTGESRQEHREWVNQQNFDGQANHDKSTESV